MLSDVFLSLRPKQYIKNLFIFAPLFFSGLLLNKTNILSVLLCFFYFCLLSSSSYLINDAIDYKEDQWHPVKSKRPIAQGRIPLPLALIVGLLFMLIGIGGVAAIGNTLLMEMALTYIFINLFYSLFAKHWIILDVIFLALGFVLRVWAGAVTIHIVPSAWLQVFTFLLALFLGFAKRRAEIIILKTNRSHHRRVLDDYRLSFVNQLVSITAGIVMVAYAIYTISCDVPSAPQRRFMIYTTLFVIYGVFRYLVLIFIHSEGGDPAEMILSDKPLLSTILLWFFATFFILYF